VKSDAWVHNVSKIPPHVLLFGKSRGHTNFDSILGKEGCVVSKVDAATNDISCVERWTKRPSYVLRSETTTIIAVVGP
jgi:hypothetical protein